MSDLPLAIPTHSPITERAPVRVVLIGMAVVGLAILVFAPLIVVFSEALSKGWAVALASLANPDAQSAIRLTLTVAAITVPANAIFGVAAAWAITKFTFRGKALLITLVDLPFSVSPVVAGLCIVLTFGANSAFGGWLLLTRSGSAGLTMVTYMSSGSLPRALLMAAFGLVVWSQAPAAQQVAAVLGRDGSWVTCAPKPVLFWSRLASANPSC